MPRDYNPDDGRYSGPMDIANIFADSVRNTINDRRNREKDQMEQAKFQADMQQQAWENENVRPIKLAEARLQQQTQQAQLDSAKFKLESERRGIATGRALAHTYNAAEEEVEALLYGPQGNPKGPVLTPDGSYGSAYTDADVSDPNAPVLQGLQSSLAAWEAGNPMPGAGPDPIANESDLPVGFDPAAAPDPGILLNPDTPVAPNPSGPPPAPKAMPEPVAPPAAPPDAAPSTSPIVRQALQQRATKTAADMDASAHEANYQKLQTLLQKRAQLPRNSPLKAGIDQFQANLLGDPKFQGWVRSEKEKAEVYDLQRTLPAAMAFTNPDKRRVFDAYYPTFTYAIIEPPDGTPPFMVDKLTGKPFPGWKVKALKKAWDEFQYKPNMPLPPRQTPLPGLGAPGLTPQNILMVPNAAAPSPPPAVPLSLGQKKAAVANAPINAQWDVFKANAVSKIPAVFSNDEVPSVVQSIRLGERDILAAELLKKGSDLVEEKEVPVYSGYSMSGMGGGAATGSEKKAVFKQIKAPNGEMMDAFDVLKLAAGPAPAAPAAPTAIQPSQKAQKKVESWEK
jgi:hypothetical protein